MYTEHNKDNKKTKRSLLLTFSLSTILLFAICSFLIKPLYISLNSNVLYQSTVLIPIIEMVILVLENLAYTICFAAAVYSIFRFSLKGALPALFLGAATLLFKSLCNLLSYSITIGYFDADDMLYYLRDFSIDLIKLICVVLLSLVFIKRFLKKRTVLEISNEDNSGTPAYNELFNKKIFFSKANPLCYASIASALVILSTELFTETRYYITYGFFVSFKYTVLMISDYLLDILIALMVYTVSLYIFSHFHSKEQREIS